MTREIKFRAWFKVNEIMLVKDLPLVSPFDSENKEYVFMQYTGLKDKNGKEIYERDIIKMDGMKTPQLIGFGSGRYCFVYDTGEPMRNITPNEMLKMEVIGNIYENPELLK